MVAVLCFLIWAVAAFRPDDLAPESTRMLHDIGWYLFLFDVSPFMVWMLAIGFAVLMNRSGERLFPGGPDTSASGSHYASHRQC